MGLKKRLCLSQDNSAVTPKEDLMRSLRKSPVKDLQWVQPKALKRYHEMKADDELYGTLSWKKPLGSLAVGVCAEESYSFKKGGFLRPYVTVRRLSQEDEIGRMDVKLGQNGVLEFVDGHRYELRKSSFWRPRWALLDEYGETVCTFVRKSLRLRLSGEVSISEGITRRAHLPLLILIGWYVIVTLAEEEATAVGAAAGGSS